MEISGNCCTTDNPSILFHNDSNIHPNCTHSLLFNSIYVMDGGGCFNLIIYCSDIIDDDEVNTGCNSDE